MGNGEKKVVKPGSVTNVEFAEMCNIHFSMASKLRHGYRKPSLDTLINIRKAFGLSGDELLDAAAGGSQEFGRYLRERVFRDEVVGAA